MMKQTDNSYFEEKVVLRIESLKLIQKNHIKVLEAFGGDGLIWIEVKKRCDDLDIHILRMDKKNDKTGIYLKGENLKFLKNMDFSEFDILDFDAYGSPYNQLEMAFEQKYKGIIHCTFIQTGMGNLNKDWLLKLGYTKEMLDKSVTLFTSNGLQKMMDYLSIQGIKKITGFFFPERKNYFYFLA